MQNYIKKEKPILFSGEMVRAILEGRKTQTRRVMKPQPVKSRVLWEWGKAAWSGDDAVKPVIGHSLYYACPYGQPKDQLWARETWGSGSRPHPIEGSVEGFEYRADEFYLECNDDLPIYPNPEFDFSKHMGKGWRPSIHMPRVASRITLEIEEIKIEQLNNISETDAIAEGIAVTGEYSLDCDGGSSKGFWYGNYGKEDIGTSLNPVESYRTLWESIHGPGSWEQNPWVWVITFKKI